MVKKVIINLNLSKASGPDCIPVVVLKNCDPELSYILVELFNKCVKESCFQDCRVSSVVPVFKNVGERSTVKNYHPVSLSSVVSKVFEKLVNTRIVDHLEKCDLFLISSMVLGLLYQLQIFSQLYLKELLGLLTSLGLLELLNIFKAFDRVWHASLLHKLSLMEFQVRYLVLFLLFFLLFSVIEDFEWFWIESRHKNIQLMLDFLKALFLVIHFSCYTLMTFLMILSVILLSVLMILLFILSVTMHLIPGNNLNWLPNLNLIYKTLWTGARSGLSISMLRKLSWFHLTSLITIFLLM